MNDYTLHVGDARAVLATLDANSIDAVVTDPPAGISFMNRSWDSDKGGRDQWIAWLAAIMGEALRVCKPGAHALVWALPRTSHWTATALEDAGWQIRDICHHINGQSFPKSLNVSKALQDVSCQCHESVIQCTYEHTTNRLPDMREPTSQDAAISDPSILLADLCGESKAHPTRQENMQGMRQGMDTAYPVPSSTESDVFTNVRGDRIESGTEGCNSPGTSEARTSDLRDMQQGIRETPSMGETHNPTLLQLFVQRETAGDSSPSVLQQRQGEEASRNRIGGREESGLEGRRNALQDARPIHGRGIPSGTELGDVNGAEGWLHHGTSPHDGAHSGPITNPDGSSTPPEPQAGGKLTGQPRTVADKREPQGSGAWPHCPRCGKPMVSEGLGTALKPATEHWILARKPLAGTVAANVLAHGTGALNIDGCRIGTEPVGWGAAPSDGFRGSLDSREPGGRPVVGRWPANVVFDEGAAAELDRQSGISISTGGSGTASREWRGTGYTVGAHLSGATGGFGDTGGASRFFFVAKPTRRERDKGLPAAVAQCAGIGALRDGGRGGTHRNGHPTVKPIELCRYLVRLITPPNGTILDPFMGSGTTGAAALAEGFSFVGIDLDPEYVELSRQRLRALGIRQHVLFEEAVS